ncbi:uncharacterized protein LOC134784499 [Penaeus indicus]|uniref:uncharacterized protein LOC134784499 n=1 Tax=Penaeus indicus TaxID=29960 RepID=UPI00300C1669
MTKTAGAGLSVLVILAASWICVSGLAYSASSKSDSSLCPDTDTLPACAAKMAQCAPLNSLLAPLLGTPSAIISCSNSTGIPLSPRYYANLGKAMVTGVSSDLGSKPTSDPVANLAIRQCVLNSTGMLGPDMGLDRMAVGASVSLLSPPDLGSAVFVAATTTCPVPSTLKITDYIKCIKKACIANAVVPGMAPSGMAVPTLSVRDIATPTFF